MTPIDHDSCEFIYNDWLPEGRQVRINSPSKEEIYAGLQQARDAEICGCATVTLFRKRYENGKEIFNYELEARCDVDGMVISFGAYPSGLNRPGAQPDFDLLEGDRGMIEIVGDEWASHYVCTNTDIATEIFYTFARYGTLAYREIWSTYNGYSPIGDFAGYAE